MSSKLLALAALTRRLPDNPLVQKLQVKLLQHFLGRRSGMVTADVLGNTMTLDPAEFVDCALLFFPHLYDPAELAFMRQHLRPGDTFLDCGSHIGLYSLVASPCVGPNGRVIAVEPTPTTYARLVGHLRANGAHNVQALNIGLSDQRETLHLNLVESGNRAANTFLQHVVPADNTVAVDCLPLALMLERAQVTHVRGAKLDIEGFEYKVMAQFFKDAPTSLYPGFIVTEFHEALVPVMGGNILELLQAHGYQIALTHALNFVLVYPETLYRP